jgi:hypothetical protein
MVFLAFGRERSCSNQVRTAGSAGIRDDRQFLRLGPLMEALVRVMVSWPDLASAGLTLAAALLGAMYGYAKAFDRVRRQRTAASDVTDWRSDPGLGTRQSSGGSLLSQILTSPPTTSPLPPTVRPGLTEAPEADDPAEAEEIPTEAEEILLTSPGPVAGRILAASKTLVVRIRRATDGHRWLQLISTAGVCLFLGCLAYVLIIPLLLVAAFGYVIDSRHDIRLRIIVVLLVAGLALEGITHI